MVAEGAARCEWGVGVSVFAQVRGGGEDGQYLRQHIPNIKSFYA